MKLTLTDQMNRAIELPFPPQRIVSVVPSQTELLFELGLTDEVVGITKFCVHPSKWKTEKTIVGGTKNLKLDKIATLQPDLIIGNKEENLREQIEWLAERFPVWLSDVSCLEDALAMITAVGEMTDKALKAHELVGKIKEAFADLYTVISAQPPVRCAYFIWAKPLMVAGAGTFIHSMLEASGFVNAFSHKTRYPEVTLVELAEVKPSVILLSSEPFPFREKHVRQFEKEIPGVAARLVDGELFSWYGSRLLQAAKYFATLQTEIQNSLKS